ncbi:MAG: HAD family hydrolase [Synergistaceae bacterium]|nr:HAD family hydrolase [Synergistota bacterium]NLM71589.1 HAD family hydrolase [Synergistaceae bacterium]
MFSCVIFDFDMTLADSSYAIVNSMNKLAEKVGLPRVKREDLLSVIGIPIRESWLKIWGRFEEDWLTDFRASFSEGEYAEINPYPGTRRVLEVLSARGVSLGLASNRQKPGPPLKAVGLAGYFSSVVGMDDVERGKPAPDMILKSMANLGGAPESTLYVGDTADDMSAARDAGVRPVGMTTGFFTPDALYGAGAWRVFDSVDEVLSLFGEDRGFDE